MNFKSIATAITVCASIAVSGCQTVSPSVFYKDPKKVSKASLCSTLVETTDYNYAVAIAAELATRNITPQDCVVMVQQQRDAAAAVAALAIAGTAVAVCANNNCGGPSYPSYAGNCQYEWQRDAAGRRCGRRAASHRYGGW